MEPLPGECFHFVTCQFLLPPVSVHRCPAEEGFWPFIFVSRCTLDQCVSQSPWQMVTSRHVFLGLLWLGSLLLHYSLHFFVLSPKLQGVNDVYTLCATGDHAKLEKVITGDSFVQWLIC